jgi:branched-chain amino acid transport system ATP-binding protein
VNALELHDVTMQFDKLTALNKVNLFIPEKTIFGLIGPNGAGKTTLFNSITGVTPPTSGKILFFHQPIQGKKNYVIARLGIARTFQNIRLFGSCSVLENVLLATQQKINVSVFSLLSRIFFEDQTRKKNLIQQTRELLKIFGLDQKENRLASSLAYGDQRKLEIIRAVATNAKVILLDEPAAGLNPSETEELKRVIQLVRDLFQITVILIEHDMKLVMNVCEEVAVLDHGKNIAQGCPSKIKENPRVIDAYLGCSS